MDPSNLPATYFDLDELRALPNMGDTLTSGELKYSDALLSAERTAVESIIERVCQTSFVPRAWVDVLDGDEAGRHGSLRLTRTWLLSVTSIVFSTTGPLSPADLAMVSAYRDGSVERRMTSALFGDDYDGGFSGTSGDYGTDLSVPWPPGRKNITISYFAGYTSSPPADLKSAALVAARQRLLRNYGTSGLADRALSTTNEFGNIQLATAGVNRPFGLPEVDSIVMGWAENVRVPGIA